MKRLGAFFDLVGDAETLAALRIVVPLLVLSAPGLREGVRIAGIDPALRVAPEGLVWFAAHVPISAGLARVVEIVTVFAALLATVGVRARPALVVLTLGATYLQSIAQLTGFVWHDMHLLWMCALLAASPCDHALAYDPRVPAAPSPAYGVPLIAARALLGAVYFFPGFWKLREQGFAWAFSDNLANQLHWKWTEHGTLPSFRIDHHPTLLHLGGLFVVVFELTAPFLFAFRRTRVFGAVLGVAFHLLAQAIFLIPFLSLWGCYVVMFDVPRILRRFRTPIAEGPPAPASRVTVAVAAFLLVGATVQGLRGQMQSYPFACYPTFQFNPGTRMPDLVLVAEIAGRETDVPHARDGNGYRTQRQWGTIWSLCGASRPFDRERLHAYYMHIARFDDARVKLQGAASIRFYRADISVDPDDRKELSRQLLATF